MSVPVSHGMVRCPGNPHVRYLSVGGFAAGGEATHRPLPDGGVGIIEGLDLSRVAPAQHELIWPPLPLVDSDGSPARLPLEPLTPASEA